MPADRARLAALRAQVAVPGPDHFADIRFVLKLLDVEREACAQLAERRATLAESLRLYYLDTHQPKMAAEMTGEAALFRLVAGDIREREEECKAEVQS